eukprot:gene12170-12260_t
MTTATVNAIRSEVMHRAWQSLRGQRGAKATPKTHPKTWRNALINAWYYAKQAAHIAASIVAEAARKAADAPAKAAFDRRHSARKPIRFWSEINALQSFGY